MFRKKLTNSTPKYAIDSIVVKYVSPLLKQADYKKSGRTWIKQAQGFTKVISVQASRWNGGSSSAAFTINYGIFVPAIYNKMKLISEEAPKEPKIDDCSFTTSLVNHYTDWRNLKVFFSREIWWEICDKTNTEKLGNQIVNALNKQCLALFSNLHTVDDILQSRNPLFLELAHIERAILLAEKLEHSARDEFLLALQVKSRTRNYYENVQRIAKTYGYDV